MPIDKQVFRSGPWKNIFAQGVRVGDTLYLAGQVSIDAEGNVVGVGDPVAQMKQAYANVQTVLAEFGATFDDVVEETVFVTDAGSLMSRFDEFVSARQELFGAEPAVAQTLVQVAALALPDLLVEIKCVARV